GSAVRMRARFSATAPGSSPTWVPRLRPVNEPTLQPPRRVLTKARTRAGAGQSGLIQSSASDMRPEGRKELFEVGGKGRLECDRLTARGMSERKTCRMQRLAVETARGFR